MADEKAAKKTGGPAVSFGEYLYANLYFWAVLLVVGVISFFTCGGVWDDVTSATMEFLFVIMGGGFTFVSILDYFYEIKIASSVEKS